MRVEGWEIEETQKEEVRHLLERALSNDWQLFEL